MMIGEPEYMMSLFPQQSLIDVYGWTGWVAVPGWVPVFLRMSYYLDIQAT